MSKKNIIYISLLVIGVLIGSFFVYNLVSLADTDSNKIAIKQATITKIDTGGNSSSNDGLDYSNESNYTKIEGYVAGEDSNQKNRIVRSFDKIVYNFNFSIESKNGSNDYEERKVTIKVTLPESITKYIAFDADSTSGKCNNGLDEPNGVCTYTFDGIDSYGDFEKQITLYVLGAPNGTTINPKFEIQESTNKDSNYLVTLGNIKGDTYNYKYDREKNQNYSTTPTTQGFLNYMPTVVSSKTGKLEFEIVGQTGEGQKATYNNKIGRYLTYVIGLKLVGDNTNGVKGYTMPDGSDISFNLNMNQNSIVKTLTITNDWIRLYGSNNVNQIEPVLVNMPYSDSSASSNKKIKAPGTITLLNNEAKISNYAVTYQTVKTNADGSAVNNKDHFIGTYAISVFSERSNEDLKNDITTTMSISGNAKDTSGINMQINNATASLVNKYYENIDYSLTGSFYNESGNKLSSDLNGKGSTSKGTKLIYKTIFNYKKTLSNEGLKEIIKIDPNAYRVVPLNDKDINITVNSNNGSKLSQNDFEVKFVSGDYNNTNYTINSKFDRISSEDLSLVKNSCQMVSKNLNTYSNDQIMNLYGGPCITGKNEQQFEKISSAKNNDSEIPITKIIIQTKKGVVLPDSAVVTVEIGIRVRNVSDLTNTYQITSIATSSDYDKNITYYAPRVTNDENSITNPNNYRKTIYQGNNVSSVDTDSTWGDSLKIVNFTSREVITVTNKNTDGTVKTNYNSNKGETINYNIKTIIDDNNQVVGADDVWWINSLKVYVTLPYELIYVEDKNLMKPEVQKLNDGSTLLIYTLPYIKPNQQIKDINFKAIVNPTLKGNGIPISVTSKVYAVNVNGETDTSYFGDLIGNFTIYATGIENVILTQKTGEEGSVVEKNSQFSYLLSAYNNTLNDITDYSIVDILPVNNDKNGSKFNGSYKVNVNLPSELGSAKVYCSTQNYSKLTNEVFNNNNNEFKECNILDEYVNATAIKITNISINKDQITNDIKINIKPESNDYSDKYINSFVGASKTYSQNESNKIDVRVISRNISGRVFIDNNEDGIENTGDNYLKDIPVTLYKLDSQNNLKKIDDTITNKDGYYKFSNLEIGRYKIRANYDKDNYDLTLRYQSEDRSIDSDAYKIEEGIAEISNYRNPDESEGIKVTRDIETVSNMNIGLIRTKTFGFNIEKYITKSDLTYNGYTVSKSYPNLKLVKEDFKNTNMAKVKVYYGIKIENNSNTSGYVKLINESIPEGSTFDPSDPINQGWINNNGILQNVSLQDDIINPGESRYVTIALNIPPQNQGKSYINRVGIEIERYNKEEIVEDININSNRYKVGEAVNYAGVSFHVIKTESINENEQILTLLADSSSKNIKMGHTKNKDSIYKWSDSLINKYINNDYLNTNSLNTPILIDNSVCDDASGMPIASYGGTLKNMGTCQSNIYNTYKIRLLTEDEYKGLANETNKTWLYGNNDFWLMNSVFVPQTVDAYGKVTNDSSNLAKYVDKNNATISNASSSLEKEIRPVITISNKNIIPE